ncbi:NADC pyrophosphorylase, partial [Illadopsis cleaveri]|nr:NADC pyrophosphorylase [Illadopsis cleaveri]
VECICTDEPLAATGAGIVQLDYTAPQELHAAEARGGCVLGTLPQFLGTHTDVMSMGCLTHGSPTLDFAL